MNKKSIALFASGNGSNALNIIRYFKNHETISVGLLVCNNANAPVVQNTLDLGVEVIVMENEAFESGLTLLQELDYREIDWIVLAGFLRKIPVNIIRGYSDRIINIHPSLSPKYGGKGMYGMHVHNAVIAEKDQQSGISIHFVNEEFDQGKIIEQITLTVPENATAEALAIAIQELEHLHFPRIVEKTIHS